MRIAGKEAKILVIILLLSFLARVVFVYAEPVKRWDETVYANLGWDLKSNPTHYSFDGGWSDYVPGDWPKAGYRAPLLPYSLALFFAAFGQNMVLLNMIMPAIGTLNVLLVYLLGRKMFNEKIGLYAAAFLAFMPVHVFYSGKILTDVFSTTLITLSFLLFVLWNEKRDNKSAALVGTVTALAVLSRYVSVLLLPIFFAFLIFKERNISFLKNKSFLLMCFSFLLILLPWLVYGYYEYSNPIGWFWHGQKAEGYSGITQQWHEILPYFPAMFSITIFLAVIGAAGLLKRRKSGNSLLLLLWILAFLFFSLFMLKHKEDRYFMQITPPLAIMAAIGVDFLSKRFKAKDAEKIILCVSIIILVAGAALGFYSAYSKVNAIKDNCFLNAADFLKNAEDNALVFTDNSPIVYFYTHRQTHFQADSHERMKTLINENYLNNTVYYLWESPNNDISRNYSIAFECPSPSSGSGSALKIYRIKE